MKGKLVILSMIFGAVLTVAPLTEAAAATPSLSAEPQIRVRIGPQFPESGQDGSPQRGGAQKLSSRNPAHAFNAPDYAGALNSCRFAGSLLCMRTTGSVRLPESATWEIRLLPASAGVGRSCGESSLTHLRGLVSRRRCRWDRCRQKSLRRPSRNTPCKRSGQRLLRVAECPPNRTRPRCATGSGNIAPVPLRSH